MGRPAPQSSSPVLPSRGMEVVASACSTRLHGGQRFPPYGVRALERQHVWSARVARARLATVSTSTGRVWTTSPSGAQTGQSSKAGRPRWTSHVAIHNDTWPAWTTSRKAEPPYERVWAQADPPAEMDAWPRCVRSSFRNRDGYAWVGHTRSHVRFKGGAEPCHAWAWALDTPPCAAIATPSEERSRPNSATDVA